MQYDSHLVYEKIARISETIKRMAFLEIGRMMKRGFRALPSDLARLLVKLSRFSGFCNKCHRQAGHLRNSCFRLACTIERQSLIFQ